MLREWEAPAFGEKGYFGRRQSIVSLARALRSGRSVSIFGGAKIGKSSLLGETALGLGPAAVRVNAAGIASGALEVAEISTKLRSVDLPAHERVCLLVDDAAELASPASRHRLDGLAVLAAGGAGGRGVILCFAGSWRWREATLHPGCPLAARGIRLKSFPMAAWDRKSAGALIRSAAPEATSEQVERMTRLSGCHPYLLKALVCLWPDLDAAIESCRPAFETVFHAWSREMTPSGAEAGGLAGVDAHPLMRYLVERGSPIAFDHARRALKREGLKAEADLLRCLGVIDRRLHGEDATAVLHAGCGLFNEWYRSNQA